MEALITSFLILSHWPGSVFEVVSKSPKLFLEYRTATILPLHATADYCGVSCLELKTIVLCVLVSHAYHISIGS